MDRMRMELVKRGVADSCVGTKDVGVLCGSRVAVNDKCVMVGTTGITALKAKFGDDFTNFEIIQDVGYSSESSTHLSGDDAGTDNFVRIYKFCDGSQPISLREELENTIGFKNFHSLPSSFDSSSSAPASLDDSGLGTGEALTAGDSVDTLNKDAAGQYEQDDLDFLNSVLDECVDFKVCSEEEELHFNISGIDSDDPPETFQNRRSFTDSAQVFYKMISVDSDNGEPEVNAQESNSRPSAGADEGSSKTKNCQSETNAESRRSNGHFTDSDSDSERLPKPGQFEETAKESQKVFCSTPVRNADRYSSSQGVKRKRNFEDLDRTRMSNHISSWLSKCTDFSNPHRRSLFRSALDSNQGVNSAGVSSCDASCECTSSSADEANVYSSSSSFFEEEVSKAKNHVDSWCSADGSVETVVHTLLDSRSSLLLPPPPSSATSCNGSVSICHKACCQYLRERKVLKASSEGDLRNKDAFKELSSLPTERDLKSCGHTKKTPSQKHLHFLSLPSVLCKLSDSSTDDNCVLSSQLSNSDAKNTACCNSHNNSSCSDAGRRRRRSRKKSSSSNRSSKSLLVSSSDSVRRRSRTVTSNRCDRSRRHSQKSARLIEKESDEEEAYPLKLEIPPESNIEFESLHVASSRLLSPIESDIVTQFEEQSTVSDQVWDGYQEMPYLSEGYSEATVDEDAVRKLTEFGDDYGSAIGQPVRLNYPSSKTDSARSPKKYSKSQSGSQRLDSDLSDDSDSEDLHYVVENARRALQFARNILNKREEGEPLTSAKYAELLATCGTHLQCLQTILDHIETDVTGHNFSAKDLNQLKCLIEDWQDLQRTIEMLEKPSDSVAQEKYFKAQKSIDDLFGKMSELMSDSSVDTTKLSSWNDLKKSIEKLQMVLTTLRETKEQLLHVNLHVHRFTTEFGNDVQYTDCSFKSDITELYRQWEDVYEKSRTNALELEIIRKRWRDYEESFEKLSSKVKTAESNINVRDCDNECLKLTDVDCKQFRKELESLRLEGRYFQKRLLGGELWKSIQLDLGDLGRRIDEIENKTAARKWRLGRDSPSACVEDDADDRFVDAAPYSLGETDEDSSSSSDSKGAEKTPREGRFWRVVRLAIPIQFALVFLYCLACYLEPSCCNMINNYNFSLTPQLRYFGSRPPV